MSFEALSAGDTNCRNANCHAPYRFYLTRDREEASIHYHQVQSWKTKYLFRGPGDPDYWVVAYFNDEIRPYRATSISSLVGEEILRAIQAGFADSIAAPITLIEIQHTTSGEKIYRRIEPLPDLGLGDTPPHMRRFTQFCTTVRMAGTGNLGGDSICAAFDINKAKKLISGDLACEPQFYQCWCGLIDYIVPVVVNGALMGVLFSGQRRMDDAVSEDELLLRIEKTADQLSLDTQYLKRLAHGSDVKPISVDQVQKDLDKLQEIARHLEREAEIDYATERQVREGHFLEEISSMLARGASSLKESETELWSCVSQVIGRTQAFLGCFDDTILLQETSYHSNTFSVVSPQTNAQKNSGIHIPEQYFDDLMPDRLGPLQVSPTRRPELAATISEHFFLYPVTIGYVIRMKLRSGRHLLLVLGAKEHICDSKNQHKGQTCCQCSHHCRRFLTQLGGLLSKELDILTYIQYLKAEETRRGAFLTRTAHGLSLPIQSILADSAVLRSEIDTTSELHELAVHNFNEVQSLHLSVENILHGAEEETQQPPPNFVKRSILEPLKQACLMFEGEAKEKRCDIRPVVMVDSSRIMLEPDELDSDFKLYYKALYDPMMRKAGIAPHKYHQEEDIKIEIVMRDKTIRVDPGKLPGKCYHVLAESRPEYMSDIYCRIDFGGTKLTPKAEDIARKFLPPIQMVPEELALAFKNIIHNAVKYSYRTVSTGRKRYVRVKCEREGDKYYLVSVSNYGIGIEQDEMHRIWQPRYRGHLSRDRNRTGSGLGLSHARMAIEKVHGGLISVTSDLLAGGAYLTKFDIKLPISQTDRIST
jgi:signal transduction histidine kinase/ligand-binding sensor protein